MSSERSSKIPYPHACGGASENLVLVRRGTRLTGEEDGANLG